MTRRSGWFELDSNAINTFKRSWPCHGFPDSFSNLKAEFADNGDLIDLECHDENGKWIDSAEFDGSALLALVNDCQTKGTAL